MITSSQNPKLKLARALQGRPKERREEGAFLAEGVRLIEEALTAEWPIRFVLYSDGLSERGQVLIAKLQSAGLEIDEVAGDLLQSASGTETSQGILAVLELGTLPLPDSPNFILIPDQIRDPGNLGTLIRTAAAAGVQAMLLPPETTDAFAPKVVRAGMGAHFWLPIHTMEWNEIEQVCKPANLQIYLADMFGQSCWGTDFNAPLGLIIGGEAEGASEQARQLANQTINIPISEKVESLNAGVAGAVLMFEVVRQRTAALTKSS
ncbi:MAG: TrmH family RNA methyltransferase [Anaerolineales bacterium]